MIVIYDLKTISMHKINIYLFNRLIYKIPLNQVSAHPIRKIFEKKK